MIVADTDVISYFWIRMDVSRARLAQEVRAKDPDWVAPSLWISEFRSVLRGYLSGGYMEISEAKAFAQSAEADLNTYTFTVSTDRVLDLVDATGHSAYDCEYVALAQRLDVSLVTGDKRVAQVFPDTAVLMEEFVAG
jgi:predicted nucleic acid-binding protein